MSEESPPEPARPIITEKYKLLGKLGQGNYGHVYLAQDLETNEKVAAKVLFKKPYWSANEFQTRVAKEVTALQQVHHRNIIKLLDHFRDENDERYWVIMKLATGGELMDRILHRFENGKAYTEAEVSRIISDVLSALKHMHDRRIVHCDLKPENILFETPDEDSNLCIVDLGFASLCEDGEFLSKFQGTLDYMAPELLGRGQRRYNAKADVWSVGCLLYVLLSGALPFRRRWSDCDARTADIRVRDLILKGQVDTESGPWQSVAPAAKQLVHWMLSKDPERRPSAAECLENEWLRGGAPANDLSDRVLQELRRFNSSRGCDSYSSHTISGIVTHNASPSALAAISAQHSANSVSHANILAREGGIQPLVSLGYSNDETERNSAAQGLANLAMKTEYQQSIVDGGGIRLLCFLALADGSPAQKFSAALAFNNLVSNSVLRLPIALEHERYDSHEGGREPAQVIPVLAKLATDAMGKDGEKRTLLQAVSALSQLARESSLHDKIQEAGALPLIMYSADPLLRCPLSFRKTAQSAIEFVLTAAVPDGTQAVERRLRALQSRAELNDALARDHQRKQMLLMQKTCRQAAAPDKFPPLAMGETTGKRPCEALSWDNEVYHQEPARAMSMDSPSSSPGLHPTQAAWNHYPAGFWEEAGGIEQDERDAKVAADWAAACMRALEQLEKSPSLKAALAQIGIATLIPTQVALSPDSAQSSRSSST